MYGDDDDVSSRILRYSVWYRYTFNNLYVCMSQKTGIFRVTDTRASEMTTISISVTVLEVSVS